GQAVGVPNVDRANLGLDQNISDVDRSIDNDVTGDGQVKLFSNEQEQALRDAGFDNSTEELDYLAREAGVTQDELDGMVELLETVGDNSSNSTTSSLNDNESSIYLRGFGLAEVPLSYGRALSDHFAVGGNLKLMRGRVYINEVRVFDEDSDKFMEDATDQYKETTTFGVDLGFMARYKRFKLGIMGRNLNAPEFEAPTVNGTEFDDVTVDPQARAGLSWQPFNSLTLETDIDLTENETEFKGYHTRYFSAGVEWSIFKILNLRAGMYTNLAEDDIGEVYTAGVGLNILGANLEVAGAMSRDTQEYEGDEYPKEARVTAQLGLKF
ncbi:MAG: conjugal transfer protein TraF, partial [Desulfohalobiaceae bacterium]